MDIDPLLHYLFKGFKNDKNPSSSFNGKYYFKRYVDAQKSGLNPLIHYSVYGFKENRVTKKQTKNNSEIKRKHYLIAKSDLFDKEWYKDNYKCGKEHPIIHYLKKGVKNNLNPNPLFDNKWYLRNNPDLKNNDPFLHFIEEGVKECLNPHPLFSTEHYLQKNRNMDLNSNLLNELNLFNDINPLKDYIETGRFELISPSADFNLDKKVLSFLPDKYKYRYTSSPVLSKVNASIYLDSYFDKDLTEKNMDFNSYIRLSTLRKIVIKTNLNKNDMYIVTLMEKQKKVLFDKYQNRPQNELVSIIMPTHNRAKTIMDSIISVISQSYENWELIIVDDGGSDNTHEVIKEFNNEKIIYHKLESNSGSSHARNIGLSISKGSIIAYLDDDDVWDPDMLIISVNTLRDSGKKSLYSAQIGWKGFNNISRIGNKFKFIRFSPFNWSLIEHGNYISMIAFLHDKSLIETVGSFDESLKQLEDWDFILRCCEEEFPVAIPCILSHYFVGRCKGHISSSKDSLKTTGEIHDKLAKRSSWKLKINFNGKNRVLFGINEITQRKRLKNRLKLSKERINLIILHHDNLDNLKMCINSITQNTPTKYDILICDYSSSSKTRICLEELSKFSDNMDWIKIDKNKGFSKIIMEVFQKVSKQKQDIVILRSDTIVTPNWLEELKIVLTENQDVGIAIPREVIVENNDITRLHSPNSNFDFEVDVSLSDFHQNVIGPYDENGLYELKHASLTCVLIRYEDVNQINFFIMENNSKINLERIYLDSFKDNTGKKIVYTPFSKIYNLQK
ncbi:MAG: glycosyltransferase [Methanobrevibacter sp.]|nr:glycosyltransferase [Methanobrevibacter sp.]